MTAASIGQVHPAAWHDGRQVAVKILYPGAGRALISDFNQLSRFARLFSALMPGLDAKPLLAELRDRAVEGPDPRRRRGRRSRQGPCRRPEWSRRTGRIQLVVATP